jgi:hypothetical protein
LGIKGSVLLHTLNGILHTKHRRAKNDLILHTVCKILRKNLETEKILVFYSCALRKLRKDDEF